MDMIKVAIKAYWMWYCVLILAPGGFFALGFYATYRLRNFLDKRG